MIEPQPGELVKVEAWNAKLDARKFWRLSFVKFFGEKIGAFQSQEMMIVGVTIGLETLARFSEKELGLWI